MKLTVIGILFFASVMTLLTLAFLAGNIPHFKVHEVLSPSYAGQECRVDGTKVLRIDSPANPVRFVVEGEDGRTLAVTYHRPRPDNFKEGSTVGLRGAYQASEGVFLASDVTTACPSKYEEAKNGKAGDVYPLIQSPALPQS